MFAGRHRLRVNVKCGAGSRCTSSCRCVVPRPRAAGPSRGFARCLKKNSAKPGRVKKNKQHRCAKKNHASARSFAGASRGFARCVKKKNSGAKCGVTRAVDVASARCLRPSAVGASFGQATSGKKNPRRCAKKNMQALVAPHMRRVTPHCKKAQVQNN